jgi:hypothetical protein
MKIIFKGDISSKYTGELVQGIPISFSDNEWDNVNTALTGTTFGREIKWNNASIHVKNSEWNITEYVKISMP